ncbi:hypothetical protein PARMER_01808 [Parabacteroides merdae ATCC 43184]|nr:hypothetical protein PARMER_01808 [Parabacteroides merdae ATCC 43184]
MSTAACTAALSASMLYTNLTGLIFDFSKINNTFAV